MRSIEEMAKTFLNRYYKPSRFLPQGLPLEVAKRKAVASNPNFANEIMALTEDDLK